MLQNKRIELVQILKSFPNFLTQPQNLEVWKLVAAVPFCFSGAFFPPPEWQAHFRTSTQAEPLPAGAFTFWRTRCPCVVSLRIFKYLPSPVVLVNISLSTSFAFCIYRCLLLQRFWCPWEAVTMLSVGQSASSFNQAEFERHGWIYSIQHLIKNKLKMWLMPWHAKHYPSRFKFESCQHPPWSGNWHVINLVRGWQGHWCLPKALVNN